ncbi:SDR family oxidoreductase [Novosphingobium panipatense]|uniref:NAD(P)-dependent dehydrogenase, short-chain alcohol dehydrogenase family n=1 Tax=Novosphingobium panipatense TaxID=428991 RepID=A0ABY1PYE5_9SPHN|nr:SDR family oxidoreductase [Novosphingobium panipatense]SMP51847.1 NAD(P)-dependent dehydrogenase, short-chain alcohol dehydrogenase family [Novosphingobium panipatense]
MSLRSAPRPTMLVTGGAKRIGAAIAQAFGAAGWHVVIHYGRSRLQAEALAARLPSAETVSCDLHDWNEGPAMVEALAGRFHDWRVLINCAGVFDLDTAQGLDPATFDKALRVNAGTPARLGQAYLAHARSASGRRLIHVTDQKLLNPNPDFFSYTMSKHALAATIPMLSMARTDDRDRVYGIAPGAILASHDQTDAEADVSHRMNLLNRRATPEDVAGAALFLAGGWLMSGETVYVDSGQHLLTQTRDVLFLARQ